jgi:hypothetical protein
MNFKPGAWLKKGIIAGVGGAALTLVLVGAGTASADETGKYCVAKNPEGKCVVYGTQPVIWGGPTTGFVAAAEAPITIDPGSDDYFWSSNYYPHYYFGVGYYGYPYYYNYYLTNGYYNAYNGYYNNIVVSSSNLPAPVYAVVVAVADALNAPRGYIYALLAHGQSLDQITDGFGVNNTTFLNSFYTQLEARIAEARSNGTMQEWQATALRTNAHYSSFITTQYLLNMVAQYQ